MGRRTKLIGTLNVTPDSFYDGGKYVDIDTAITHAKQLISEGADVIDLGGEGFDQDQNVLAHQKNLIVSCLSLNVSSKSVPFLFLSTHTSPKLRMLV